MTSPILKDFYLATLAVHDLVPSAFPLLHFLTYSSLTGIREWFRWYKIPDGKPLNKFGYNEECLSREMALKVVEETHQSWKRLVASPTADGYSKGNLWIGKTPIRDDSSDSE